MARATSSTEVEVARQATTTIPIVFSTHFDPVGTGHVSSLARPGGNATGISNISRELAAKRLALLKDAVPAAKRIAAMFNPNDPLNALQMEDMQRAAILGRRQIGALDVVAVRLVDRDHVSEFDKALLDAL